MKPTTSAPEVSLSLQSSLPILIVSTNQLVELIADARQTIQQNLPGIKEHNLHAPTQP